MASEEKKQILKMVAEGKITAEEAMRLIKVLEENPSEDKVEIISPAVGAGSGMSVDAGLAATAARTRRLWQIPLWVGVGVTVLGGALMYWAMQAAGFGFWFYCAWLPFLLGVAAIALAVGSRRSRWLFVKVEQKPGDKPGRFVFGFPLPLRLAAWFLRNFGHHIRDLDRTNVDEILVALNATTSSDAPLIVNVDEGENGERVQVFIG